ncbi:GNAT family N-acetyltransferase [Novosphingobium kaempferiae]|uniref:GNAT family N-acetyltransferase n=1 Tax=Novosphingobium kaempferiae TaxID=2896849 RepID=UPI001E2980CE|nr:GNAT family N-acetyltransferase [Novosphingobium kaempferiae]
MTDAPLLLTDRFELWRPAATDLPGLCRLLEDVETRRYLGPSRAGALAQFERLLRNAGSWMLYGYGTFVVRAKGEDEIVATCGVFHSLRGFGPEKGMDDVPEAGWIVRHDWWGKGVAGEVMAAAFTWFDREHGPKRVACMIEEGNSASERVAARFGFAQYGTQLTDEAEPVELRLYERVKAS